MSPKESKEFYPFCAQRIYLEWPGSLARSLLKERMRDPQIKSQSSHSCPETREM
jgi:hypothetical protein